MTAENLRSALRKRPFRPFEIKTASGATYPVTHPEVAWISPAGEVVIVALRSDRGEQVAMLDLPLMADIVYSLAQPAGRVPEEP